MKSPPFKTLLALALLISASAPAAQIPSVTTAESRGRDAVECIPRAGLPTFFAKLEAGKPVKIGYLGGSITAQNGWRVHSRTWFQQRYPQATVSEINAAIGGTGSTLGVFRIEHDALAFKPDLLFVEFAVNDHGTDPAEIQRSMEGIVRKTWRALPECDICFVYTVTAQTISSLQAGKVTRAESAMEALADHYKIPSINLGVEISRLLQADKLTMTATHSPPTRVSGDELNVSAPVQTDSQGRIVFSPDGVHPFPETGHVLYLQAIARSMEVIRPLEKPRSPALITALVKDNLEGAKMATLEPSALAAAHAVALDPAKDKLAKSFARQMPALWKLEPGATLRLRFSGTRAAFYDLLGPDCGELEVTLDGKSRQVKRIDSYCTYHRLSMWTVGDQLSPGEHEIVVKVLPTALDKRSILFEKNRADFDANVAKYTGANWYVGALLVAGDSP